MEENEKRLKFGLTMTHSFLLNPEDMHIRQWDKDFWADESTRYAYQTITRKFRLGNYELCRLCLDFAKQQCPDFAKQQCPLPFDHWLTIKGFIYTKREQLYYSNILHSCCTFEKSIWL